MIMYLHNIIFYFTKHKKRTLEPAKHFRTHVQILILKNLLYSVVNINSK